jgi:AmiR/NasT family two-component response regulator
MRTRSVSDADAYRIIREQAMSKRVASEEIARAIIHADGILSFSHKGSG